MANHSNGMAARSLVVFRGDHPAHRWTHPEHIKIIARYDRSSHQIGLIVTVQAGCDAAPGNQSIKDVVLVAQLGVVGVGENTAGLPVENEDQVLRMRDW